jgi:leucine dehydrogenase
MGIFELMRKTNTSEVMFYEQSSVGLKAIVTIDNTVLGPALATSRFFNYKTENEAIEDAINIAFYNSFRSGLLRSNFGGGSIVLYGDPKKIKSEMYFRALGIFLNKLNGKIFMAKGPGITFLDMLDVKRESRYILGLQEKNIVTDVNEITSTAKGMIWGLKAAVKEKMDKPDLTDLTIVVQGVGEVGSNLIQGLLKEKANVIITDLIYDKIKVIQDKVPNIKVVKPDEIYKEKCDIFCSCAVNGLITRENIKLLNCKILTGSVNKVCESKDVLDTIKEKNILYIPGFIINTGEIIQFSNEREKNDLKMTEEQLIDIYHITLNILKQAKNAGIHPEEVAYEMSKTYVNNVASIKMLK